mmetsp:Transcript_6424/g.17218  ORF Transcript_6424/g.17218 Transcript_6424/m.17218 type:complete len:99 (-) Transcript_6424:1554-1850(-)
MPPECSWFRAAHFGLTKTKAEQGVCDVFSEAKAYCIKVAVGSEATRDATAVTAMKRQRCFERNLRGGRYGKCDTRKLLLRDRLAPMLHDFLHTHNVLN